MTKEDKTTSKTTNKTIKIGLFEDGELTGGLIGIPGGVGGFDKGFVCSIKLIFSQKQLFCQQFKLFLKRLFYFCNQ